MTTDNVLLLGDSLLVLTDIPDNSIDAIVTDPPYGLSFMGKKWDYDVPSVEIWREALRVLKPGGHLLSFGGTRTYHRMVVNIEDAGFEIRDQIQWLYGSGFPKSLNLKDEYKGWGTALKPANEPIVLARKPPEKGLTIAQNVQKWGCGAINIDGSRVGNEVIKSAQIDTSAWHGNSFGAKPQKQTGQIKEYEGRWPANVILDETAAEMLDEQVNDNVSRFFYVAKTSKRERNAGLEGMPESQNHSGHGSGLGNAPTIDGIRHTPEKNNHPTVKPIKLMSYLIKLITPSNGTVLDPFMGSGSTGVACKQLGFKFIGIEREKEYVEIAERRINNDYTS